MFFCLLCEENVESYQKHCNLSKHRSNLKEKPIPRKVVNKLMNETKKPSIYLLNKHLLIKWV